MVVFGVRRREPELVGPACLTPRETKRLSDLDDIDALRFHVSLALFYRGGGGGGGVDVHPAGVIRRALGQALVQYYPLAGRLREIEGGRLVVECTGEGVRFVQAEAEVQLADLEEAGAGLRPPFHYWDQLLSDVEGFSVIDSPLLHLQVTRFLCGGFVLALRFSHTMCDGIGIAQFMTAVSELARGLPAMTVTPVWSRELVVQAETPPPPPPTPMGRLLPPQLPAAGDDDVTRCFTFTAADITAIKKQNLPATTTTFEALAAFLWRARTAALDVPPGQDAPLAITANFRGAPGMSLPAAGYYGNASPPSMVTVNAAALRDGSLADAVELVRQAKAAVTAQYFRSTLGSRGWPVLANLFYVSDLRRLGLARMDFGWGEPVFAGAVHTLSGGSFFSTVKDQDDGEDAIVVPIVLPRLAMDRFTAEVDKVIS